MVIRYLENLFRHLPLLLLPIAFSGLVATGWVASQPREFQSSAKIWVDRSSLGPTSPDNAYSTAADVQTQVLTELLKTRSFGLKVAARGPLASDIVARASGSDGANPLQFLQGLSKPKTQAQLDDLTYLTVSKNVSVQAAGPQIVAIDFTYPDAVVGAKTTQAIVDQFIDELLGTRRTQADYSVSFFSDQVKVAQEQAAAADAKVYDYLASHPELRVINAVPDVKLTQLRREDDNARDRYVGLLTQLDQAKLVQAEAQQSSPNGLRVLDAPLVPTQPMSSNRVLLQAGVAGLAGGLVITLLALVLITMSDTSLRRPEDVELFLGFKALVSVPQVASLR
jgi:uncharacterized protein involved in exopolysaccharide biosynthesis